MPVRRPTLGGVLAFARDPQRIQHPQDLHGKRKDQRRGYVRIRLDQTAEDKITGYNRPEHLRAFTETHETFTTIQKPLRASAESANRYTDDHHPREPLHHYGFQRNNLSMLAWQAHQNAQTETIFAQHPLPHREPLSQTG